MTPREQLVIDRKDVKAHPWTSLGVYSGVRQKILWRDPQDGSYAGLLRLDPGAHVPEHQHHNAAHHAWVVSGACGVGSEALGPGSYCFVPAGTAHDLIEVGLEGCTLFYLSVAATREELAT